ncbi:hypothetical protein [Occallatibacter savannae]|uniref:hypothetical protein n=1 Tax=Occallatibacter savannae TaxID=1002691 RepID=UPI000D68EE28|nr:hypothetical protein [Occallatibacter savannae]
MPWQSKWRVRDRNRLLLFLINELAGAAHISLEGDLPPGILEFPGASGIETEILKRGTLTPAQHFAILPLERATVPEIVRGIGGTIPRGLLHIQIEKGGRLAFAAYDNFHPDCTYFGEAISADFIERLIANKCIAAII